MFKYLLLFAGGILIFLFEYSNPLTIGTLSLPDKLQVSFFQSVTTRTAGFATIPQQNLTTPSSLVCLLLIPTLEKIINPKLLRRALRKQKKSADL